MLKTCAIIEDHLEVSDSLQMITQWIGFKSYTFLSCEEFLREEKFNFSCYLIDWNLPGLSGIELIPTIKEKAPLATIFLMSGRAGKDDIQAGLEAGADDYLIKPFNDLHLRAKLKNQYKKLKAFYEVDITRGIKFFPSSNCIVVEGKSLILTPLEYRMASLLHQNRKQFVSRNDLMRELNLPPTGKNLEVTVNSLRKKIQPLGLSIITGRNQGYLLS